MKHRHHSHAHAHPSVEQQVDSCCSTNSLTHGPRVHSEEHHAAAVHTCCSSNRNAVDTTSNAKDATVDSQSSIDPVCGMRVGNDSAHSLTHDGQRFVFCSAGCREKFAGNPAQYMTAHHDHRPDHVAVPARKADTDGPAGTIYTCPMHPQVRQVGPGNCPICGMALEPEAPAEQEDDREIRKVRTKFWTALAFTLPVVGIAMLPHLLDLHVSEAAARVLRGMELLLSAPVVLWPPWTTTVAVGWAWSIGRRICTRL